MFNFFADLMAILSALFFSVSNISVKRGLPGSNPFSAFFVDVGTSAAIFAIPLVYYAITVHTSLVAIAWFAASGVVGTTLGRVAQIYSIHRMGASVASTIANLFPIFSTATAVLFLGESLTVLIIVGTTLMILGLFFVSSRTGSKTWSTRYLLAALGSAVFFGLGTTLRKIGIGIAPNPLFGVAVTVYAAFVSLLVFRLLSRGEGSKIQVSRRNLTFFAIAGVNDSLALIALFLALEFGQVTIVGPLSGTVPLFVLVLAFLFLKQSEVVHKRLILAAVLVVIGVVLLSL
jgi:uncharacterized membrane protein